MIFKSFGVSAENLEVVFYKYSVSCCMVNWLFLLSS